ncbi:hypothetical protein OXYTRIMIC_502 [Oxytricha trifallax]|uniref:Uncharacterized protein n=1 Tax=Oxytricha trifallax TaxID=1172189 RepID=A0A073ICH5_9SPIT|nr:hypothetical protein OXYTRIMIC_502 [Oxytricha trifallax]
MRRENSGRKYRKSATTTGTGAETKRFSEQKMLNFSRCRWKRDKEQLRELGEEVLEAEGCVFSNGTESQRKKDNQHSSLKDNEEAPDNKPRDGTHEELELEKCKDETKKQSDAMQKRSDE